MLKLIQFLCVSRRGNAEEVINKYHRAKTRYESTKKEFNNVKENLQVPIVVVVVVVVVVID